MNFEKILEWGVEYLSDYISVVVATIRKPTTRFKPMSTFPMNKSEIVLPSRLDVAYTGPHLNPKLISFVIISIFLGSTINALIPSRKIPPDFIVSAIVVIAIWFIVSCITHGVCKLMRGKGSLVETLSVSLQVIAVLYVISNLATLILGVMVVRMQQLVLVVNLVPGVEFILIGPIVAYFLIQLSLLAVYLPIALKYVHGFGCLRQILIGVVLLILLIWMYMYTGIAFYEYRGLILG